MRVEVQIADESWERASPQVETLVLQAAGLVEGEGEAVVLLADDDTVRGLNARFRDKDAPTNVLAFPSALAAQGHAGDIVLAYGVCAAEAAGQGKPLDDHLRHLVIHGLLHLRGYDHIEEADAEIMEAIERALLGRLGVADPYADGHASHAARS